jgi:hypothetical protein
MGETKLKLEMDALRVESFETAMPASGRGTVRGNAVARCDTNAADCDPITCGPSCIGPCTSNGAGAALAGDRFAVTDPVGSDVDLCTNDSYVQTCIFYTCGGCTTADPAYC